MGTVTGVSQVLPYVKKLGTNWVSPLYQDDALKHAQGELRAQLFHESVAADACSVFVE
jgi:glycosidase